MIGGDYNCQELELLVLEFKEKRYIVKYHAKCLYDL